MHDSHIHVATRASGVVAAAAALSGGGGGGGELVYELRCDCAGEQRDDNAEWTKMCDEMGTHCVLLCLCHRRKRMMRHYI